MSFIQRIKIKGQEPQTEKGSLTPILNAHLLKTFDHFAHVVLLAIIWRERKIHRHSIQREGGHNVSAARSLICGLIFMFTWKFK